MENGSISLYVKKWELLKPSFYSLNTIDVAKKLLGKILVVRSDTRFDLDDPRAGVTAGKIVETEAYRGNDPASHSAKGQTPRCEVMFGEPAIAYVYFIYGMYEMLNFVTEPQKEPGAVLIRALEPIYGEELMKLRRAHASCKGHHLTNGPGKLCRALNIKMSHNRQSLAGPSLFVYDDGKALGAEIKQSPRVGIRLGKEKLWRFLWPAIHL